MQWIPTAERLPTADDLKVRRPYWREGFTGYIEGLVTVTIKSDSTGVRKVEPAWCVIPPPYPSGLHGELWFETPDGKPIDEFRNGLVITAWSPVDVPGPYQEGDE